VCTLTAQRVAVGGTHKSRFFLTLLRSLLTLAARSLLCFPGKSPALSPPRDALADDVAPGYLQQTSPSQLPLKNTHSHPKPVITPSRNMLLSNAGMLLTNGTFRPSPLLHSPGRAGPHQAYPQIHEHLPAGGINSGSSVDSLHHTPAGAVGDDADLDDNWLYVLGQKSSLQNHMITTRWSHHNDMTHDTITIHITSSSQITKPEVTPMKLLTSPHLPPSLTLPSLECIRRQRSPSHQKCF
jgi:hypothetical protein